jgi:hypothetical protein
VDTLIAVRDVGVGIACAAGQDARLDPDLHSAMVRSSPCQRSRDDRAPGATTVLPPG